MEEETPKKNSTSQVIPMPKKKSKLKRKVKPKLRKAKHKPIPKPEPLKIPEGLAVSNEIWNSYPLEKQQRFIRKMAEYKPEKRGFFARLKKHD